MSEAQAKKVFLKQAKPFLKRYDAERRRKNKRAAATIDFNAAVLAEAANENPPVFAAEFTDVVRGRVTLRVPIMFNLPPGYERGFRFTDALQFYNFRIFCGDAGAK